MLIFTQLCIITVSVVYANMLTYQQKSAGAVAQNYRFYILPHFIFVCLPPDIWIITPKSKHPIYWKTMAQSAIRGITLYVREKSPHARDSWYCRCSKCAPMETDLESLCIILKLWATYGQWNA